MEALPPCGGGLGGGFWRRSRKRFYRAGPSTWGACLAEDRGNEDQSSLPRGGDHPRSLEKPAVFEDNRFLRGSAPSSLTRVAQGGPLGWRGGREPCEVVCDGLAAGP